MRYGGGFNLKGIIKRYMKHEVLIQTEKVITIDDLQDSNHIGFTFKNSKGYIVAIDAINYRPVDLREGPSACNMNWHSCQAKNLKDAVKHVNEFTPIEKIYLFDTRKELYQWLAE